MISGTTQLIGLLGWPVAHSFSPVMHNAAAEAVGLDVVYVPLPVPPGAVEAAVRGVAALGFLGANVTVPHKQAVMAYLDEIEPAAQAIGAVNTIRIVRGKEQAARLTGYNSDGAGFMADLAQLNVPTEGRSCLVLGAGGAARAVVYGLGQGGGRVHVFARRPAQARRLVAELQSHLPEADLTAHDWEARAAVCKTTEEPLLVNTTPVGMHPQERETPWPAELPLPPGSFVYDLVYNPRETRLMEEARAAGCQASNGLGMLLQQGALAFEIWTGRRPPVEVMGRALGRAAGIGL